QHHRPLQGRKIPQGRGQLSRASAALGAIARPGCSTPHDASPRGRLNAGPLQFVAATATRLAPGHARALSSAVERLAYTEDVGGSNPSVPIPIWLCGGGAGGTRLDTPRSAPLHRAACTGTICGCSSVG